MLSQTQQWFGFDESKPEEDQTCLIYNPCEGYQIAVWRSSEEGGVFCAEPFGEELDPLQSVVWSPLVAGRTILNSMGLGRF